MIDIGIKKKLEGSSGSMNLEVSLKVAKGELITIFGKSGAGKSSLLRILAGLMVPEKGTIEVNDEIWLDTEKGINIKAGRRGLGMVFQDFGLFPNMTVQENLVYGLKKTTDREYVNELLQVLELGNLAYRKPGTLSGGQQQRVALARALAGKPELLLLDEPLSALDRDLRQKLQNYVLDVHRRFSLTTLMVSHDVGEIFKMSNRVLHLVDGKVSQYDSPLDIFSHRDLSGKFQFTGEVIQIEAEDVVCVITIMIDNHLVKIIVDQTTGRSLNIGDRVLVASKAFNPLIRKIQ